MTTGITIFLASCSFSPTDTSNATSESSTEVTTEHSAPTNIYTIKGEDIAIRTGPGKNYDKVVIKKTSDIMHETVYATVDFSVKVREDETNNDWSKITVVEPDYLSESHQGWIETKYIAKEQKSEENPNLIRKVTLFNDVSAVQKALGQNGIGALRKWRGDELGWMSSSDYYSFGSSSADNGMQNNLAYYLESNNQNSVKTVKLILNINNATEKSEALSLLGKTAQETFTSLNLQIPKGLINAIKSGKYFNADNSNFSISFSLDKSKIDTWKLTLETK